MAIYRAVCVQFTHFSFDDCENIHISSYHHQTGNMNHWNIRLIEDVLYEIENGNSDAVVLMLNMEKTFDKVEWGWLFNVINHFNFVERFISWLMAIYRHA